MTLLRGTAPFSKLRGRLSEKTPGEKEPGSTTPSHTIEREKGAQTHTPPRGGCAPLEQPLKQTRRVRKNSLTISNEQPGSEQRRQKHTQRDPKRTGRQRASHRNSGTTTMRSTPPRKPRRHKKFTRDRIFTRTIFSARGSGGTTRASTFNTTSFDHFTSHTISHPPTMFFFSRFFLDHRITSTTTTTTEKHVSLIFSSHRHIH